MSNKETLFSYTKSVHSAGERAAFYVTNRQNALSILSTGMIMPREGYEKHYPDFLDLCKSRVPLWFGKLPHGAIELVSDGRQSRFPVIFEILIDSISGDHIDAVTRDLAMATVDLPCDRIDDLLVIAPCVSIPIDAVRCMHFQSRDDLNEFLSRKFGNIKLDIIAHSVSPSIFEEEEPACEDVFDILMDMSGSCQFDEALFRKVDCLFGAFGALLAAFPVSRSWIKFIKDFSRLLAGEKVRIGKGHGFTQSLVQIPDIIFSDKEMFCAASSSAEEVILEGAIKYLVSHHPREGWVPQQALDGIARYCAKDTCSTEVRGQVEKWHYFCRSIVKAERDLPDLHDTSSPIQRAVLLLVLREDLERIFASKAQSVKPGENVYALAAMLGGMRSGYTRLPAAIKGAESFGKAISSLSAAWINSRCGDVKISVRERKVSSSLNIMKDRPFQEFKICLGEEVVFDRSIEPPPVMMQIYYMAHGAGYTLDYDQDHQAFSCIIDVGKNRTQKVYIQDGSRNFRGKKTIRFLSQCMLLSGRKARRLTKKDALDLLERNSRPNMYCRFAYSEEWASIIVLVDQIADTIDKDEFIAHMQNIATVADKYESERSNKDIF